MIEIRTCIKCSKEFQRDFSKKVTNICKPCTLEYQRNYARKKVEEKPEEARYKDKYPLEDNKRREIWKKRVKLLDSMEKREEWKAYFKQRLDYMEENEKEILIWIYDRRDQESRNEFREHKMERVTYEDTRTTHQNKSWFD